MPPVQIRLAVQYHYDTVLQDTMETRQFSGRMLNLIKMYKSKKVILEEFIKALEKLLGRFKKVQNP